MRENKDSKWFENKIEEIQSSFANFLNENKSAKSIFK